MMKKRDGKGEKGRTGFTLIEVLISITILTIVLGAVYSSFFSVQRAMERFDGISMKYHEARSALDIMRREIESSFLKDIQTADPDNEPFHPVFIIKDRDILGKITSSLELTGFSFRGSGLHTVSYFVEEKEGEFNLLKKEVPPFFQSEEYVTDIIEGIESFTVETLYNNTWVSTWDTDNTGMLPGVVRVGIEFDDNGTMVKLTEYARLKIGKKL